MVRALNIKNRVQGSGNRVKKNRVQGKKTRVQGIGSKKTGFRESGF
jgi:hypothetical protein